ncbi:hypothetical protein GMA77_13685 [Turicibacter sanguinis]|nr:hypothetical protein [Turicibacter sanguinis]
MNHYITLVLFILIGCIFNIINPSLNLILLLPYSLILTIFSLGFSWLLSAINVYLRDVQQLTGIIINLWFYFSPILYPVSQVPETVAFILKLNPIYHIVYGYRAIIFNDLSVISIGGLIYVFIVAICTFAFGGYIFKKLKRGFSDIL